MKYRAPKTFLKPAFFWLLILTFPSLSGQTWKLSGYESDATSVKLHWEPLENIKEYLVYRNNNCMGSTVSNTGYFTDFRVPPGKTFKYYVDAVFINGNLMRSDTISVSTKLSGNVRTRYKVLALAFYPGKTDINELNSIKTYFRHRLEFIKLASLGSAVIEPYKNDIIVLNSYPPSAPQSSVDYTKLVKTRYGELDNYSIIDLIEKGDIDFVWVTRSPDGYNFGENALIGNKNIGNEISGWVSNKVGCSRSFFINAYLPDERCNDAYAHMVEGIMTSICNSFPDTWPRNIPYSTYSQDRIDFNTREIRNLHLFERFRLTDQWGGASGEQYASDGNANCGTSHFPPNARRNIDARYSGDYAYFDQKTWQRYIDCYADDWLNFPDFKNVKRKINGYDFGAFNYYEIDDPAYNMAFSPELHESFRWGAASYHQWWFSHLPHNPGVSGGRLNNWWPYIFDFNRFYGSAINYTVDGFPSISPIFYPVTSNEIEDTVTDNWAYWHSYNGFSPFGKNGFISLTDKTTEPGNVKSGNTSIKVTVQNAELYESSDVGSSEIFYPRTKNAGWYLSYLDSIHLSIKPYINPFLISGTNPVIKLCHNEGNRIELVPLKNGAYANLFLNTSLKDAQGWYNFSVPLTGNGNWEKNIIGYIDPALDAVSKDAALIALEKEILANINYIKICIKSGRIKSPVDICTFYMDDIRFGYSKSDDLLPYPAGAICGDTVVCFGEGSSEFFEASFDIAPVKGATSYIWTLPSGDSLVSTDNRINTRIEKSVVPGFIKVKGHNQFGYGYESIARITEDCTLNSGLLSIDDIMIFPNPTNGMVEIQNIKISDTPCIIEVNSLFSNIGSFGLHSGESQATIDLSGFPPGIYFIKFRSKNKSCTFKILKL